MPGFHLLRLFQRKCRAFLRRDFLFESSYRLQFFVKLMSILFFLMSFYFLSKLIGGEGSRSHLADYGGDYFTYALIGITFMGFFDAGLIDMTTSLRQQLTMGVLEAMAVAPIRSVSLLFYTLLWPMGFQLLKAVIYISAGVLLFGAEISLRRIDILLAALGLSIIVFGSLGIVAGSLLVYFKRGDPIAWFFSSLSYLACGVIFPVSILPDWIQILTRLLPITYALEAIRASMITGMDPSRVWGSLQALLIFAIVLVPTAIWCARVVFDKARQQGSLGQY